MLDNATVQARTREVLDIASQIEEEPWSNPLYFTESPVADGYAEWAATYDDPGNPVLLAEEPVIQRILARYPVGTALDAACGTGRHTEYLASLGHEVTGVDATPEMLELAAAKVPEAQFESADLTDLPFADGEIDLVVCTLALTHCADLGPPITELARVLRPGGHLVISDVHPFDVVLSVQGGFRRKRGGRGFVRNYVHLTSDYLNAFQQAGLSVLQCKEPLWEDQEIATIGFSKKMPELLATAVKGLPIAIVWELQKSN
ncbi:MAG: class I SAM-dependent methyltransferase [Dehalococcoidia bacterium]|nr:class I SAM-dependent methyltransferase [Dehalococcoidia bacterium]